MKVLLLKIGFMKLMNKKLLYYKDISITLIYQKW
jgi:hypothetical protein